MGFIRFELWRSTGLLSALETWFDVCCESGSSGLSFAVFFGFDLRGIVGIDLCRIRRLNLYGISRARYVLLERFVGFDLCRVRRTRSVHYSRVRSVPLVWLVRLELCSFLRVRSAKYRRLEFGSTSRVRYVDYRSVRSVEYIHALYLEHRWIRSLQKSRLSLQWVNAYCQWRSAKHLSGSSRGNTLNCSHCVPERTWKHLLHNCLNEWSIKLAVTSTPTIINWPIKHSKLSNNEENS